MTIINGISPRCFASSGHSIEKSENATIAAAFFKFPTRAVFSRVNKAAGATRGYVLRASQGQVLTGTLSSSNGKADFTQGGLHDTQYSQTVEENGDVYISVDNHGNRATRFTLTISIQ
ncbi:MAG: hypothetical protein LH472_00140 [Pyrinomonadaceae bacterium]|nr:hypothetical protein [Pyrinomonadaceae bacterium]